MSSYDPPEESDEEAGHDLGVKGKEVIESREFAEIIGDLERIDYIKIGVVLALPAGLLTVVLVFHTAGCNKLKEFATPGWRISLRTYSRQYHSSSATLGCIVGSPGCGSAKYSRISSSDSASRARRSAASISSQPGGTSRPRSVKYPSGTVQSW